MESMLIVNAHIVDPQGVGECTGSVLVKDGRIAAILREKEELPKASVRVDAGGCLLFPGLIDAHVHFRDPGFTDKEDIASGAAAAAHGGFTGVVMMGNTRPPMDAPETIEAALKKGAETPVRVYCCGNVTVGMQGRELTDFAALKRAGAVLLSDDGLPVRDAALMEEACRRAAVLGLVISLHEEDPAYIEQAGVNAGPVAASLGLGGADRQAEISMVERDLAIAAKTGAEITVQHISAAESVELIRRARRQGIRVHAEATPHHFTLEENAVRVYGTNAKMNPPLRTADDRAAIIEGLRDGTIDMIATDHAPHTGEEKSRPFTQAPSGIIGLETSLALAYRELVLGAGIPLAQVIGCMTQAARVYHLAGGHLQVGEPADLTLFDPRISHKVEKLCSRAENTPFMGEMLPGNVRLTLCGGRIAYAEEALLAGQKQ